MDKIYEGVEMEIKKVQGAFPEEFEKLRGGTFINLYPTKVVPEEENDNYEYYQYFTLSDNVNKEKLRMEVQLAKDFLDKTDHKFFSRYKPKEGEDLDALEIERDYKREFIRLNEGA